MTYSEKKKQFQEERKNDTGWKAMQKVTELINQIGKDFLNLDGGELAEVRSRLIGYKFYLSEYLADLERSAEGLKISIKEVRAKEWNVVSEEIKARDGKVKNKEQIENEILLKTSELQYEQILYQSMYHEYKLKISSIDDVVTAITQRVAELKRQIEDAKYG